MGHTALSGAASGLGLAINAHLLHLPASILDSPTSGQLEASGADLPGRATPRGP